MVSQERLIECKINILNAVMVINRSGGSTQDREIIIIWQSYLALEVKILSFRTRGPLNELYLKHFQEKTHSTPIVIQNLRLPNEGRLFHYQTS